MRRVSIVSLLATMFIAVGAAEASAAELGKTLFASPTASTEYTRVIKLADGSMLASYSVEYAENDWSIRFARSTDNGQTFTPSGEFRDPSPGRAIGAATIHEVTPGTLLLSYGTWDDRDYTTGQVLKVWRSTDGGASWVNPIELERNTWTWEPEFSVSADGKLQLYYSWAPTMNQLDQVIARRESSDGGRTWSARITALGSSNLNIGMPRITRASGTYYMAYENYEDSAQVHLATSSDGKAWSTSTVRSVELPWDAWIASTPAIASVGSTLFVVGLRQFEFWSWFGSDENNGKVIMYSKDGGRTWREMPAPFELRFDTLKAGWSSALVPVSSTSMLMMASSHLPGERTIRYGTGPIVTP